MHIPFANRLSLFGALAIGMFCGNPAPAQTTGKAAPLHLSRYLGGATKHVGRLSEDAGR
jgi:hypothetical protein